MTRYPHQRAGCPARLAVLDIETLAPPAPDGSFPPWPTHEPIVASILTATLERYGQWRFELESVSFLDDGAAAIERTSHLIEGRTLVTYNGRGFDCPVLALAAMKHQHFDLAGISQAWQSHRFTGGHYDLADIVSGFGGARGASLERLCTELGIPVKIDTHGSDVAELMAKRQFQDIQDYCEQDVASTLCLFAMVEGLRSTDPHYAGALVSQFGRWVADRQLAHLQPFERVDGHRAFDRLSLQGIVDQGIASLEHRQHMAFVTNLPGQSGLTVRSASDF